MWTSEEATKLLSEFKAKLGTIKTGTSGKADAGGKANAPDLYSAVAGHGLAYTRKRGGGGKIGGGYILDGIVNMAGQDELDEKDIEDLEFFQETMGKMIDKGSSLNPANIVFRGVIKYSKGKGGKANVERGKVWGHFLTPAYHAFRKAKAKKNNETYNMEAPDPKWHSLKDDGSARPPLWQALFGEGGLSTLVDSLVELVGTPIDLPPTPEVEVANVRRKTGNLATVPAIRNLVEEVLQDKTIYIKGNNRAPNKGRLKEAFNNRTIAVTEEDMKIIAPLVFVKVEGQDVRLSEIPGYLDRRSIGLNFTYKMARKLIKEVLGERFDTYETPKFKAGETRQGLVLKAVQMRKNLLKALADIDPDDRPSYDSLQDIIDGCSTHDMDEFIPALELIAVEMGRTLSVRVYPGNITSRSRRGTGLEVDLNALPHYFIYIASIEPNMTEPAIYAVAPSQKTFISRDTNREISGTQLMQHVRGLIA